MRAIDLEIDSEYHWDGTNGHGIVLSEPCNVTVVGKEIQCLATVVFILTPEGVHWDVLAKALSPIRG